MQNYSGPIRDKYLEKIFSIKENTVDWVVKDLKQLVIKNWILRRYLINFSITQFIAFLPLCWQIFVFMEISEY